MPNIRSWPKPFASLSKTRTPPSFATCLTHPTGYAAFPKTNPRGNLRGEKWMNDPTVPQDAKNYAVMVSMIDRQLGEVLALLKTQARKTPFSFLQGQWRSGNFRSQKRPAAFRTQRQPQAKVGFRGERQPLRGRISIRFSFAGRGKSKPGR